MVYRVRKYEKYNIPAVLARVKLKRVVKKIRIFRQINFELGKQ